MIELLLILIIYSAKTDAAFQILTESDRSIVRAPVTFTLDTDFDSVSWSISYDFSKPELTAKGILSTGPHSAAHLEYIPYSLSGIGDWIVGNTHSGLLPITTVRQFEFGIGPRYDRINLQYNMPTVVWDSRESITLGTVDGTSVGIVAIFGPPHAVISLPPILPGDYNGDGVVDTKDYVVARDNKGALAPYLMRVFQWRHNYGRTITPSVISVPEPRTIFQILLVLICLCQTGRERIRDYYRNQSGRVVPIQPDPDFKALYQNVHTPEQLARAMHYHREIWIKRHYYLWAENAKIVAQIRRQRFRSKEDEDIRTHRWRQRVENSRQEILKWNHPTEPNSAAMSFYPSRHIELRKKLQKHEMAAYDKLRVWNLKDGRKIRAVLGLIEPQAVILIDVPGSQISVRRSKLSAEDKKYVLEQYRSYTQDAKGTKQRTKRNG